MFRERKSKWEVLDDFDPTKLGFKYDPTLSIHSLVSQLLVQFQVNMPPGKLTDFVAGILLDGVSFWQLAEEFRLKPEFELEFREMKYDGKLYGIPLILFGVEGLALALKPCLAPAVLRQQLAWNDAELEAMRQETARFANMEEPPIIPVEPEKDEKPKKEDMH